MMDGLYQKPYRSAYVFCLSLLALLLIVALGSATTAIIINTLQSCTPALYEKAQNIGLDRIARRSYLLWAVLFLLLFLKQAGWKGLKDIGWNRQKKFTEEYITPRYTLLLTGIAIGLIAMCALLSISIITRTFVFDDDWSERIVSVRVMKILINGIFIGIFEETLCRGIFFKVLARRWRFFGAAVLTSLIFALAHFASPHLSSFDAIGILQKAKSIFVSTILAFQPEPRLIIHICNLTLLGVLLCFLVELSGTIWLAAGIHLSAVWAIKSFSFFTTYDPAGLKSLFQSSRTDMMDSLSATILFIVFILLLLHLLNKNKKKEIVKALVCSRVWRINKSYLNETLEWLKNHPDIEHIVEKTTIGVLKKYQGCSVILKDGVLLKEYHPVSLFNAIRLSLKKPRVQKAFEAAMLLNKKAIPAAQSLAYCVIHSMCLIKKQYLLVKEITSASRLEDVLKQYSNDSAKRTFLLKQYGMLAAAFHKNKISNRDMKYENIVCTIDNTAGIKLFTVDLDGVSKKFYLSRYRVGRDLRRIGLSLASIGFSNQNDISSFFEGYNAIVPTRLKRNSFPE